MLKERKKTSVFYTKYTDKEIKELVASTTQVGELIKLHEMVNHGSNSSTLRKRLDSLGVDYSHWTAYKSLKGPCTKIANEVLFTNNNVSRTGIVKKRIIKESLLPHICNLCGCTPTWQGKPLVLILDHIDGCSTNNELANLQLVCPNCNSQLATHAGKNTAQAKAGKAKYYCSCGAEKSRGSNRCLACVHQSRKKLDWENVDLSTLLVTYGNAEQVGKALGVSGACVRKQMKRIESRAES